MSALSSKRRAVENKLKQRWDELMRRLDYTNEKITNDCFEELVHMYSTPPRAYHNLDHVMQCLDEFEQIVSSAEDANAVEFAIWYHDCIYDSTRKDNEDMSASKAYDVALMLGQSFGFADKVAGLIDATKHRRTPPWSQDAKLIIDIDLSILGQSDAVFDEYEENIRKEYRFVPDDFFRSGRAEILQSFLDRPSIYYTDFFKAKYEEPARRNLKRSIAKLKHPG